MILITSHGFASPEFCESLHKTICPRLSLSRREKRRGPLCTDVFLADGRENGVAVERLERAKLDVKELYVTGPLVRQKRPKHARARAADEIGTCLRRCRQTQGSACRSASPRQ